jgi:hypothetical protein
MWRKMHYADSRSLIWAYRAPGCPSLINPSVELQFRCRATDDSELHANARSGNAERSNKREGDEKLRSVL